MKASQQRIYYGIIAAASTLGLAASFLQLLDKLAYLKNPSVNLICNVSSVFNCSNVLEAWQSSVFGFPNSIMCMVFFTIVLGVALAGATGSGINKWLRLIMHFFALFFLGFGAWYIWQSIYVIGSICIYCTICYTAVILMNFAWVRLNVADMPYSKKKQKLVDRNWDLVFWILWLSVFVVMMITKFYL